MSHQTLPRTQEINCFDFNVIKYQEAWHIQNKLRELRLTEKINDSILLLEHFPVFTMGKRDCAEDFCSSKSDILKEGIEIIKTNRGGRITYHGEGQLVCYFILNIDKLGIGIKNFVCKIENIGINVLKNFNIDALRDEKHPGLWVNNKKIMAIGLNIAHGITEHGFALNVNCSLKPYKHIIACGVKERGITTMSFENNGEICIAEVKQAVINCIQSELNVSVVRKKIGAAIMQQ